MADSEVAQIPGEIPVPAAPVPRFLKVAARRPFAVLALLGLLLWLPGVLSLPPLDRDESRFAESSRQMVESGDPVDIRFGHVPRYKKPIGIYWLQATSTAIFGRGDDSHIWTYRLPSLAGALLAARLTVWCAAAFLEAEAALIAGLLLLSTVLLAAEATIATTDAVLLATVVAVQGVLLRLYRAARENAPAPSTALVLAGWAALAVGVLVKGPVTFGVAAATIIGLGAWDRDVCWLKAVRPLRGLLVLLVLVLPWLIAITIQSHGAFLQQSVGNDFATKLAGGQESHGAWPGYYLLLSAATLFPAVLFVAPGLVLGFERRQEPAVRLLLVWAIVWWAVVEIVPTKLPHYVLHAYPPLAILAAMVVTTAIRKSTAMKVAQVIASVQFVLAALLMAAVPFALTLHYGQAIPLWLGAFGVIAALLAVAGLGLALSGRKGWAVIASLAAMLIFTPGLTAVIGPRLEQLWLSEKLKTAVAQLAQPGDPPPMLAGYQEPSMVFDLGPDVMLTDGAGAAQAGVKFGGLALIEASEKGAFLARLAELQATAEPMAQITGLNYSRGRATDIVLYRVAPVH